MRKLLAQKDPIVHLICKKEGSEKEWNAHKDTKAQRLTENGIGKIVVDECIQRHRASGPRLLEIVYEVTLARGLEKKGLKVIRQVSVPIEF